MKEDKSGSSENGILNLKWCPEYWPKLYRRFRKKDAEHACALCSKKLKTGTSEGETYFQLVRDNFALALKFLPKNLEITTSRKLFRKMIQKNGPRSYLMVEGINRFVHENSEGRHSLIRAIEEVDSAIPELLRLKPDVIVVTGDHSTPALLKAHSWHPVPLLLYSKWCRPDKVTEFGESACISGALGRFPAKQIMLLAMANALKLTKFGA